MRLAQQAIEKKKEAQNAQSKYTKNFSTLPTKTGATFKESYKEKLRREKEDKERDAMLARKEAARREAKERRAKAFKDPSVRVASNKKPRAKEGKPGFRRGRSVRKDSTNANGKTSGGKARRKMVSKKANENRRKSKKRKIKEVDEEQ